jgi:type II secretory pathway pseudopilin PulG
MIALLIVALAVLALAAVLGVTIFRSRERKRQEERARSRRAAATQARKAEEARRAWASGNDDELTSVMPAIKLPWPTQTAMEDPPRGYPELERDYPDFDRNVAAFEPDWLETAFRPEEAPAAPERPRDEDYIVPPARAASLGGEHILPPPRPAEYPARGAEYPVRAGDRAHRRGVGQGSHRSGGHAKRRRG